FARFTVSAIVPIPFGFRLSRNGHVGQCDNAHKAMRLMYSHPECCKLAQFVLETPQWRSPAAT
ncbi:MAG TPA: hypothetical protein VIQ53_20615, partial [Inquilinus sp.]